MVGVGVWCRAYPLVESYTAESFFWLPVEDVVLLHGHSPLPVCCFELIPDEEKFPFPLFEYIVDVEKSVFDEFLRLHLFRGQLIMQLPNQNG